MSLNEPTPHRLGQLQRWMQAVVMHSEGVLDGIASEDARRQIDVLPANVEQIVTRSRALTAVERLAIYHNAYHARLLECLREEFPVLAQALGEETFDAFAVDYLQRYPSRSYTLGQLGVHFARYLAETRPTGEEEGAGETWPDFLIDLATLEWTFNEVFDGPGVEDEPLLDGDRLRALPPGRWPEVRLVPVCCLRLLALRFPAHDYFTSVRREGMAAAPEPCDTFLAVTRRDFVVRHYELSRPAYELLRALSAGTPVGPAVAAVAENAGPDLDHLARNLHDWFRRWAEEGFFQSAELPAESPTDAR